MTEINKCAICRDQIEEGNELCESCNDNYTSCDVCSSYTHMDNILTVGDYYLCGVCFNERYFNCDYCNELTARSSMLCVGNNHICENCYNVNRTEQNFIDIPFKKLDSKRFIENPYKNYCGIELECYGDKIKKAFNQKELLSHNFSSHDDGSLNSDGVEFVSNPANGDTLFNMIRNFTKEANKRKFYVDRTTGYHLHIQIPKNIKFIKKMVAFYRKFEDYLFYMLPQSRADNHYCYKLAVASGYAFNNELDKINELELIKQSLYFTKDKRQIKRKTKYKYENCRYCWLNLHSLFYRGTLEIRSHAGTLSSKKILNWIKIHLKILDFINKNEYTFIRNMPKDINLFLSLFDDKTQRYIKDRIKEFYPKVYKELFIIPLENQYKDMFATLYFNVYSEDYNFRDLICMFNYQERQKKDIFVQAYEISKLNNEKLGTLYSRVQELLYV